MSDTAKTNQKMQQAAAPAVLDPEVRHARAADGATAVQLSGAWDIRALESRARSLAQQLKQCTIDPGSH